VRQIALNLLSNSIKFTGAGGQVIVATALNDAHEVVLRVRDTGPGMSEKELQTAMEPFRQLATANRSGGSGLGLPISKALAEANRARFHITSQIDSGTLVEVAFPATRVLAQ
jgi:signal transduction histidine kinase